MVKLILILKAFYLHKNLCILTQYKMGIEADEISKEFNNVWVDDAPTTRTVYNWISHSKGNSER